MQAVVQQRDAVMKERIDVKNTLHLAVIVQANQQNPYTLPAMMSVNLINRR